MNPARSNRKAQSTTPLPRQSGPVKDDAIRILGYKATDVAALAAFALTVIGYAWYLANWWRGADVEFFPPDQVELRCSELDSIPVAGQAQSGPRCSANSSMTITATSMSYVNRGDPAYHAVIRRERVDAKIGDRNIVLDWMYFSNITTVANEEKVAAPTLVLGGQAAGHETRFFPRIFGCEAQKNCDDRQNFLPWSDFLTELTRTDKPIKTITLKFIIDVYGMKSNLTKSCIVEIDETSRKQFKDRGVYLFTKTLPCRESK